MTLIDKAKLKLKIDDNVMDSDIHDTIDACKADLILCGVLELKIEDTDFLVVRAIKLFCMAEYSSDDKESVRYRTAYESLRDHLCLSQEYTVEVLI